MPHGTNYGQPLEPEYSPSNAELGRVLIKLDGKLDKVADKQDAMALTLNTVTERHGARLTTLERRAKAQAWFAKTAIGAVVLAGVAWAFDKASGKH